MEYTVNTIRSMASSLVGNPGQVRGTGVRLGWLVVMLQVMPAIGWAQRDLQTIPDVDPAVELASFSLPEGMQANLFAGDGQISKPIHMNFDAKGRLWVAGSEVYPHIEPGQPATDKIFVLEDTTGDGQADVCRVFADDLLIPTGILPDEKGGCYVANSTELIYLWDSDGDGRADGRRVVLSGFGTEDTHHLLHTLTWAPDGSLFMNQSIYIHSHVETPWGVKRMNGGGVWRFRPDTMELEVHCLGFVNPWGKIFDPWGQGFATDGAYGEGINYVFPNSVFVTSPGAKRIVGGMNPGSPKHCGLERISGRHFPESWIGNMITNDFRANRVCRFEVQPEGSAYRSRQLEEVIRSTHQAFRPIDAKMGADGALYIADWYNPIIQHGEVDFRDPRRDKERGRIWRLSFPNRELVKRPALHELSLAELLPHLDSPEASTRIWAKRCLRLRPLEEVKLSLRGDVERLLSQKIQPDAVAAVEAREQALLERLWAGLNVEWLDESLLDRLLQSTVPSARAAAVRVASDFLHRSQPNRFEEICRRAVTDEHPQVRLEGVCATRRINGLSGASIALRALERPVDSSLDFALWKTLRDLSAEWLPAAQTGAFDFGNDPARLTYALKAVESADVVGPLLNLIERGQVRSESVDTVVAQVAGLADQGQLDRLVDWIAAQPMDRQSGPLLSVGKTAKISPTTVPKAVEETLSRMAAEGLESGQSVSNGQAWIQLGMKWQTPGTKEAIWALAASEGRGPLPWVEVAIESIAQTLQNENTDGVSLARARYREWLASDQLGAKTRWLMIGELVRWSPEEGTKQVATALGEVSDSAAVQWLLRPLLQQKDGQTRLANQIEEAALPLNSNVAREAIRLVRASAQPSNDLIQRLRTASGIAETGWKFNAGEVTEFVDWVRATGEPTRGEKIYRRAELQCMNCHAIGGVGSIVGPDMISIGASAPVDYLLESLVDPAAKVKEGYHSKKILTIDGRVLTGMVQSFSDGVYRLRLADGALLEVEEEDIEEIADGTSLMPVGLVDELTKEELRDLVSFLSQLGRNEAFSIRSGDMVRGWQGLEWNESTHRLLNRTSLDSVAARSESLPWKVVLPEVSGRVPLGELSKYKIHANVPETSFLRTQIEVVEGGEVWCQLSSSEGIQAWVDGTPYPVVDGVLSLELSPGLHELILAVDRVAVGEYCSLRVVPADGGNAAVRLPLQLTTP